MIEHAPAFMIAVPLFAAFATSLFGRLGKDIRNLWVVFSLILTGLFAIYMEFEVLANSIQTYTSGASIPSLTSPGGFPVRIVLELDAINALISLIAVLMSLAVVLYSWKFMEELSKNKEYMDKFYSLILLFVTGMIGMSISGDFFTLFVFLEITSISSAPLISFFRGGESFEAAFKYMIISAVSALFMLFGIGILYSQYGALNMAAIANEVNPNFSFLDKAALSLMVSAILLKLGSFPVHMWKADIYQKVPSNVAAMCITSSLVGVYVLSRILFSVFFSLSSLFGWIIVILGILSIFTGATMALIQTNLKRIIAYIAIAEIGYILLGLGTGLVAMPENFGFVALSGGIFHIINDALDMSLLFLIAGAVFYATRKININDINGLAHVSRPLSILFIIGMFAASGLPPLNGFVSKLMIYESVFCLNPMLAVIGILGSIIMLAVFVKIFISVFLGSPYSRKFKRIPFSMMAVMWVIAFFILLLGIFPEPVINNLVMPAVNALINHGAYMEAII